MNAWLEPNDNVEVMNAWLEPNDNVEVTNAWLEPNDNVEVMNAWLEQNDNVEVMNAWLEKDYDNVEVMRAGPNRVMNVWLEQNDNVEVLVRTKSYCGRPNAWGQKNRQTEKKKRGGRARGPNALTCVRMGSAIVMA